ncbi:diguanylate cyclase [uncultured Jatrophihabitans sp.]|uniref:GGDEF domain-containing protein n=1 Tax=uncultured Jatrophihabitans sp. TaxID=1610747 RepID=UPI0035CC26C5
MTAARVHGRRSGDNPALHDGLRAVLQADANAAALGQFLLISCGLAVVVGAALLGPRTRAWLVLAVISAVMVAAIAVSNRLDWTRLPARATLIHPVLVALALTALGAADRGEFAPLTGVLVLCFAYIGLTQRPGTSLVALAPAAAVYLVVNASFERQVLVRLAVVALIWLMLGEMVAQMTARRNVLTQALHAAAHSDALTGVSNRRGWDTRVRAAASGDAIVLFDLDRFKEVNDVLGHAGGDAVLSDFGAMLRHGLREGDFCARFGGEEFALLLPGTSTENATVVLARLRGRWAGIRPEVTFSSGVAVCRAGRSVEDTLAAADAALYESKAGGRNTDRFEAAALNSR